LGEWNINYYNEKLKEGNEYERYVVKKLKEEGTNITLIKTYEEQINVGESLEGYEIKFDDKYKETGNLWIETQERSDIKKEYVDSGILRNDNTIFYVIGNYDIIFIFEKKKLKEILYEKEIIENNMKTSKGYLLTTPECFFHSKKIIEIKTNDGLDSWL